MPAIAAGTDAESLIQAVNLLLDHVAEDRVLDSLHQQQGC